MDKLPVELLYHIASFDLGAFEAMLAVPAFARTLTALDRWGYRALFNDDILIGKQCRPYTILANVVWLRNGAVHRTDGPAIECDRNRVWTTERCCCSNIKLYMRYRNSVVTRMTSSERDDDLTDWLVCGTTHRAPSTPILYADGCTKMYINGQPVDLWKRFFGAVVGCTSGRDSSACPWCISKIFRRRD